MARRFNQQSKLGSYLDPIADKVLLGCVVGALGYQVCFCGHQRFGTDILHCIDAADTRQAEKLRLVRPALMRYVQARRCVVTGCA